MPSLDELRGTIVGLLNAPATKVVRVISEPAAKLARVFGGLRGQGSGVSGFSNSRIPGAPLRSI